jgi:hypothetical protein
MEREQAIAHLCIIKTSKNNMKFNVLVIVCALVSASALADAPASLSVIPASTGSVYNVHYKTSEAGKVKVSIFNNSNQLVFSEVLNNVGSFVRPYNFSQLAEGEYTIILEDKNGRQVQKVNYTLEKVTTFIKVVELAGVENKYILNISNSGTEDVTVKIYDNTDALLHEQTVQVTGSFGVVYNLYKVKPYPNAKITFEISTEGGVTKTITF